MGVNHMTDIQPTETLLSLHIYKSLHDALTHNTTNLEIIPFHNTSDVTIFNKITHCKYLNINLPNETIDIIKFLTATDIARRIKLEISNNLTTETEQTKGELITLPDFYTLIKTLTQYKNKTYNILEYNFTNSTIFIEERFKGSRMSLIETTIYLRHLAPLY